MEEVKNIFNVIYSHFILRDLFGKIVPGSMVLIMLVWYSANFSYLEKLFDLSLWPWLILIGLAWIIGFAIQSLGEFFLGWFKWGYRYFPKVEGIKGKKRELENWYNIYVIEFLNTYATENEIKLDERMVVIKEACGNGFIATILILILYWSHEHSIIINEFSIILTVIGAALWRMHVKHFERQYELIQKVINSKRGKK